MSQIRFCATSHCGGAEPADKNQAGSICGSLPAKANEAAHRSPREKPKDSGRNLVKLSRHRMRSDTTCDRFTPREGCMHRYERNKATCNKKSAVQFLGVVISTLCLASG